MTLARRGRLGRAARDRIRGSVNDSDIRATLAPGEDGVRSIHLQARTANAVAPGGSSAILSAMANVAKRGVPYDPTVYPSEDHRGEGSLQRFVSELLHVLLER